MKKVDEKKVEDQSLNEKTDSKAAAQRDTMQASADSRSLKQKHENAMTDSAPTEKASPSETASQKSPTKSRERNDNWDDLGDEAPGSRIRLY